VTDPEKGSARTKEGRLLTRKLRPRPLEERPWVRPTDDLDPYFLPSSFAPFAFYSITLEHPVPARTDVHTSGTVFHGFFVFRVAGQKKKRHRMTSNGWLLSAVLYKIATRPKRESETSELQVRLKPLENFQ
jgi:hypothetical protein